MNNRIVKARISEMSQLIQPIIKKKPEFLILHIETNDATTNDSRKIVDDILLLKSAALNSLPDCRVLVSKPTLRSGNGKDALMYETIMYRKWQYQ